MFLINPIAITKLFEKIIKSPVVIKLEDEIEEPRKKTKKNNAIKLL